MVILYSGLMDKRRVETDSDEEEVFAILNFFMLMKQCEARTTKQARRDRSETGVEFVYKVLSGHPDGCYDLFRMEKHVFHSLCHALKSRNLLNDSKFVQIEEHVAIFF